MPFWEITKKDLILLVRDARALFILVAFPLIFITIIGLTTGQLLGWKNENQILKIGIVDNVDYEAITDSTERRKVRNIVHKIVNRIQSGKGRRAEYFAKNTEFQSRLDNEELDSVLVIGPDFHERIQSLKAEQLFGTGDGEKKDSTKKSLERLSLTLHSKLPESSSTRTIIEELLLDNAAKAIWPYLACRIQIGDAILNRKIYDKFRCADLETEDVKLEPAVEEDASESSGKDNVYQVLIPSYTVMFVFFLVNIMARSFLQERDLGTLRRLRMAPVSSPGLVAGKTIPFLLISLVQTALLFVAGRLLFGMTWGPIPVMLIPVVLATSLAATGLGLLVATLVKTDSQVSAYANIIVISMAGFSGCFMPRNWLPEPMQNASLATPHAWALMSYEQLLIRDVPDLALVWQYCGVMVLFSVVFFTFGCWRFRSYD